MEIKRKLEEMNAKLVEIGKDIETMDVLMYLCGFLSCEVSAYSYHMEKDLN